MLIIRSHQQTQCIFYLTLKLKRQEVKVNIILIKSSPITMLFLDFSEDGECMVTLFLMVDQFRQRKNKRFLTSNIHRACMELLLCVFMP